MDALEMVLVSSVLVYSLSGPISAGVSILSMSISLLLIQSKVRSIPILSLFRLYATISSESPPLTAFLTSIEVAVHLKSRLPRSMSIGVALSSGVLVSLLPGPAAEGLPQQLAISTRDSLLLASYLYEIDSRWAGPGYLLTYLATFAKVAFTNKSALIQTVSSHTGVYLLSYWAVIVPISVSLISLVSVHLDRVTTRKLFHFLAAAVFVPGIVYNKDLIHTAFVCAMGGFIAVEFLRKWERFAFVTRWFSGFIDVRDTGEVALTHIFLLLACGLPLLLGGYTPLSNSSQLGVAVLCVGDSFAAIIGHKYGRHYIYGRKTYEGTVANLVSMAVFTWAVGLEIPVGGLIAIAVYEAITGEIDNYSVPVFAIAGVAALGQAK